MSKRPGGWRATLRIEAKLCGSMILASLLFGVLAVIFARHEGWPTSQAVAWGSKAALACAAALVVWSVVRPAGKGK